MNQLLVGAIIPFLCGVVLYVAKGFRAGFRMMVAVPALMGFGMAWAVAPDIPRLLGMNELYQRLANDPRCDVFFWHYSIDRVEADSALFAAVFVAMACSLLLAAWRELMLAEGRDAGPEGNDALSRDTDHQPLTTNH